METGGRQSQVNPYAPKAYSAEARIETIQLKRQAHVFSAILQLWWKTAWLKALWTCFPITSMH